MRGVAMRRPFGRSRRPRFEATPGAGRAAFGLIGLAAVCAGCGRPPGARGELWPAGASSGTEWRRSLSDLERLRRALAPAGPYTMRLSLELREPVTGRLLRARGAVAVSAEQRALRMMLLGPGGTTALDLWSCGESYRFALPAADLVRRDDGTASSEPDRGLPVGFLRWWLLEPLAGRLLYAGHRDGTARYVLAHGEATIDVRLAPDGALTITRSTAAGRETVASDGARCPRVRYQERSTGLDIRVTCENVDVEHPPRQAAFADPDDPSRPCPAWQGALP